eukprot:gnl/TRDRNA2_/TRDRNA2_163894_c1_seq1.p1 gnl/TRDRNA2_/TRDRNA2_163894_c1~~gnl/TRDRNA2_/TRDRNA2_163894_c1_seq1.p1  ORF type:complete len:178 (-),score=29.49 gnl/TRDRNA2_/TRDRNA2_163894_c1_seq1:157-663(-)
MLHSEGCLFCRIASHSVPGAVMFQENDFCFAIIDKHPVTPGHCLIIPKAHRADWWEMTEEEVHASNVLLKQVKEIILRGDEAGMEDKSTASSQGPIVGWNIGMNCGAAAGQTVFHCHVHLIPRREGDMGLDDDGRAKDPRGGVRGVIPQKQDPKGEARGAIPQKQSYL